MVPNYMMLVQKKTKDKEEEEEEIEEVDEKYSWINSVMN